MKKFFVYGASMYPEILSRDSFKNQLTHMKAAGMNTLRLTDSSWGNLEPAPGQYDFDWLLESLDVAHALGYEVILGTGSFLPPVWLSGGESPVLVEPKAGEPVHPHSRKACCINGEFYRERIRSFLKAFVPAVKNHPSVIAWQLDNELDAVPLHSCHCQHCEQAWTTWLQQKFGTPDAMNEAMELRHWGMRITAFEQLPLPRGCLEHTNPHALVLQHKMFERDRIFDFFRMQAEVIRDCGSEQPLMHDWMLSSPSPQNDPQNRGLFDIAGLNVYPQPSYGAASWDRFWMLQDMARTHGQGSWLCSETITTACGSNMLGESPLTREQFRTWMLQMIAFGSSGLIYWSGNRFRGGNFPYWGGMFDWTEQPEPELEGQIAQLGKELQGPLKRALETRVQVQAAMLMDYDQACAVKVYPHTPDAAMLKEYAAQSLRRMGLGVDMVPAIDFEDQAVLDKYSVIVLAACPTFDSETAVANLLRWVEQGGFLLVGPVVSYQSATGVFRKDGLGANLKTLTGCIGRSIRKIPQKDAVKVKIGGLGEGINEASMTSLVTVNVEWENGKSSPLGLDGWCELLDGVEPGEEVARFAGNHPVVNGRPAAVCRHPGKGTVLKLGFWPKDDAVLSSFLRDAGFGHPFLTEALPPHVSSAPQDDGSLWIINPIEHSHSIRLAPGLRDRLTGNQIEAEHSLQPFEILWLEK